MFNHLDLLRHFDYNPTTNVVSDQEYEIDLPGVKKEDIDIEATNSRIDLKWSRNGAKYHRYLRVPHLDADKVSAKLENGVLSILVPKTASNGHKVTIT